MLPTVIVRYGIRTAKYIPGVRRHANSGTRGPLYVTIRMAMSGPAGA